VSVPFLSLLVALAQAPVAAGTDAAREAPVVVIDPGHPSEVSRGDFVQNGTTEVHVAWEVALRLRRELERRGYRVRLTKARERELVRNRRRAEIANRANAALMIRLHCDATSDSGFALYYPDRAGTAHGRTGPTADVMARSRAAAESLHVDMAAELGGVLKNGGVRGDSRTAVGARQGALTGSIFSEVPVVTVEMVVLSNARDARFISDEDGQLHMARALAKGVERFVPLARRATPGPR
jgi:N-acetylmuramoyl-L-alanine amidase